MKHDFLTRMREIFAHFLSKLNEDTCHYINGPETLPPPLTMLGTGEIAVKGAKV